MDDIQKPFGKPCMDEDIQRMWDKCEWKCVKTGGKKIVDGIIWQKVKWEPSRTTLKKFNDRGSVWWYFRKDMEDYEIFSKSLVIIYWKDSYVRIRDFAY